MGWVGVKLMALVDDYIACTFRVSALISNWIFVCSVLQWCNGMNQHTNFGIHEAM
jgi:hypothetical protein